MNGDRRYHFDRHTADYREKFLDITREMQESTKGSGLDETLDRLQRVCDEQGLARPITEHKAAAEIVD